MTSGIDNGKNNNAMEPISDERCLICNYGGELVMCDFSNCTKVYHRLCLGPYPFTSTEEEDTTTKDGGNTQEALSWYCPQHTCAVTGVRDVPPTLKKTKTSMPMASPSPVTVAEGTLWKCMTCPVAVSNDFMTTVSIRFFFFIQCIYIYIDIIRP